MLEESCFTFLEDDVTPDTVCEILEASHALSESEVYEQSLSYVKEKFTDTLKSRYFSTLCMKCLEDVMAIENFMVKEEELFENLIRWAENECKRQELDVSWENKRKVLGGILYKVRFPLMEYEYFCTRVAQTGLLSEEEKVDVFVFHVSKKEIVPKYFQVNERLLQVMRCDSAYTRRSVCMKDTYAMLGFAVSHDTWLHGFLVYGCSTGTCEYIVEVEVTESSNKHSTCIKTKINTSSRTKVYPIMLESSLQLKAYARYVVSLEMTGNRKTYRGDNEKDLVSYGVGKLISFNHKTPQRETGLGQIPGLLLTE